jgi:ABC-type transport system substrate-binding protein
MLTRRAALASAAAAAAVGAEIPQAEAAPAQVLRIGMTASDLPTVTGIPNNGSEGYRFLGYPAYDGLINWDFTHTDRIADIVPGIATFWQADAEDPKRWVLKLREDAVFHDGSKVDADAVIWNLRRIYDDKAPQYDGPAAPIVRASVSMLDRWEKIDDHALAIWTSYQFAFFPYVLTRLLIASPTQWEAVGRSWVEFAKKPSGTGPFKITRVMPGQYAEMSRNEAYWDKARIPKLEKLIVYPMAEATTRLAALRSGQVDWIEVPPPDAIPSLKAAGFQISLWPYPHSYPYELNVSPTSIFHDVRVRQAANYAIDREALCKLINDTGRPSIGLYPPDNAYFGTPKNRYSYDPAKAKALLAEAGFGPGKPAHAKIMISTSGSGQMVPIPMNEFLQQNFKAVGMEIEFDVVDWGTMLVAARNPPSAPQSHNDDGMHISLPYSDPGTMFRYYASASFAPRGYNWGQWSTPEVDKLLLAAQSTFDQAEQTKLLAQAHGMIVDAAPWLFIVHDLNPRALSKKVTGFRPAQSWYQDFTQITMA